jgi:hypothetical protein
LTAARVVAERWIAASIASSANASSPSTGGPSPRLSASQYASIDARKDGAKLSPPKSFRGQTASAALWSSGRR